MPTNRRRHTLTETDALADALQKAAEAWPQDAPSSRKLLLHLIEEGSSAVGQRAERTRSQRLRALTDARSVLSGTYPAGYLKTLHDEWPG